MVCELTKYCCSIEKTLLKRDVFSFLTRDADTEIGLKDTVSERKKEKNLR